MTDENKTVVVADGAENFTPRVFGPKEATHPTIDKECPTCGVRFAVGDFTTLLPTGPLSNTGPFGK